MDRKRVGRRRQTGLEIGEPTDSLSTLSGWYYEANVRSDVPPERERDGEYLPIHSIPTRFRSANSATSSPLFIQHSTSRNIFQLCLRRRSICALPRAAKEGCPRLPRLIPRILIMTRINRILFLSLFLSFFFDSRRRQRSLLESIEIGRIFGCFE